MQQSYSQGQRQEMQPRGQNDYPHRKGQEIVRDIFMLKIKYIKTALNFYPRDI